MLSSPPVRSSRSFQRLTRAERPQLQARPCPLPFEATWSRKSMGRLAIRARSAETTAPRRGTPRSRENYCTADGLRSAPVVGRTGARQQRAGRAGIAEATRPRMRDKGTVVSHGGPAELPLWRWRRVSAEAGHSCPTTTSPRLCGALLAQFPRLAPVAPVPRKSRCTMQQTAVLLQCRAPGRATLARGGARRRKRLVALVQCLLSALWLALPGPAGRVAPPQPPAAHVEHEACAAVKPAPVISPGVVESRGKRGQDDGRFPHRRGHSSRPPLLSSKERCQANARDARNGSTPSPTLALGVPECTAWAAERDVALHFELRMRSRRG